ncbi:MULTISPECIES: cupin domain-containing protein [Sinorhizobium]|uniref:Allophanate hydrolase n=2 Tax=Sinorhizobium TaxID=28105 RepID=A0A2S3YR48_9HYPH|nr:MULTISPECIES: cupin domain-containing protein [Sinorhizobium]AUX77953.1 cupin 2 domain-containing protein [Sinorhizobium fredii]PDT35535.1 allophanate hydrolase [Sinorhizobium sp. FG01]PDT49098.1 allophanate hydrolase [Sinorhizobium sp. NG07B]POH33248.1 allophanate hydrolase [Sinorhizobium americanum]POH33830.1 allophanate hydrolase [Sinorhizobium americanum]
MPETTRESLTQGSWRELEFEPFRDGVMIHWIKHFEGDQPAVALLRYEVGASVPRHRHEGLETILVLTGTQSDESGDYGAGTYIVNAAGTEHSVWSDTGCAVLIQWDRPVTMLQGK